VKSLLASASPVAQLAGLRAADGIMSSFAPRKERETQLSRRNYEGFQELKQFGTLVGTLISVF
jgi:hypothetical protein